MFNVEEKVANSNQNKHIVAPPQCQVERHLSHSEEEFEHVDFRMRRVPDSWNKVRGKDDKTADKTIVAKSALRNYRNNTTTLPIEEKENFCNTVQV